METIKSYLDNLFANLPKTSQTLKIKDDLLFNMEEKYNELKKDGKSENEAIGVVISEFGNIDELVNELGIQSEIKSYTFPTVTKEVAESFMAAKKESGLLVGIGVSLCIIGAAMLMLIPAIMHKRIISHEFSEYASDSLGLTVLLILIVPAVALFIYSGMKLEKYKYL